MSQYPTPWDFEWREGMTTRNTLLIWSTIMYYQVFWLNLWQNVCVTSLIQDGGRHGDSLRFSSITSFRALLWEITIISNLFSIKKTYNKASVLLFSISHILQDISTYLAFHWFFFPGVVISLILSSELSHGKYP